MWGPLLYKCGTGAVAHTSFDFLLFSDAVLWVSCNILWECGVLNLWGPLWPNSLNAAKSGRGFGC